MKKPVSLTVGTQRHNEGLAAANDYLKYGGAASALCMVACMVFRLDLLLGAGISALILFISGVMWSCTRDGAAYCPTDEEIYADLERIAGEQETESRQ
jgi:hypothetical protein